MIWDYGEVNPFGKSRGDFYHIVKWSSEAIEHCSTDIFEGSCISMLGTATKLQYPNNYFDAVITDPPYYDNVPYSYLSDFFYVWLKRTIGDLYPDLFATPLTPKSEEIVAYSYGKGGFEEGKRFLRK